MDAKGAKALQQLLAQRSCLLTEVHLTEVHLRRSDVDDDECRALCEALELNTASQLQVLDLADNLIGQKEEVSEMREGYVTGGEALGAMLAASSTLTVLNLSWNSIRGTSAKALASALKANATLTVLNLSHNRLDEDGGVAIADALETNTSLTEVRMAHCFVGAKGAIVLSQALTETKYTTGRRRFRGERAWESRRRGSAASRPLATGRHAALDHRLRLRPNIRRVRRERPGRRVGPRDRRPLRVLRNALIAEARERVGRLYTCYREGERESSPTHARRGRTFSPEAVEGRARVRR